MKKLALLLLLVPSIAHADQVGASLEIMPTGTIVGSLGGFGDTSSSANTAIGFGVLADHAVARRSLISVGFAPRFFFGVKGSNDNGDSAEELDLRLRATIGGEVAPKIRPYFFVTPGYSILFLPDNNNVNNGNSLHPHGFEVGLGGGVSYDVSPTLRGFAELGYQWGFQGGSFQVIGTTTDYKLETRYLGIAIGATTEVAQ